MKTILTLLFYTGYYENLFIKPNKHYSGIDTL